MSNTPSFMVDTVKGVIDWPLNIQDSSNWDIRRTYGDVEIAWEEEPQGIETKLFARNRINGIRLFGSNGRFRFVEAELPKMFAADNGHLIESHEQLQEALLLLELNCGEVADSSEGIVHFTRVDLGLHFPCDDPRSIIRAHRPCRYPRTRGERFVHHDDSSSSWDYPGRRFAFYDKGRQINSLYGNHDTTSRILRVEIQLRKRPLKTLLGGGDYPTALDFMECYRAFRQELLAFAPPRHINPSPQSKEEALAILGNSGFTLDGKTPLEIFTEHMTPPTRRKWQREVARFQVTSVGFDWSEILPPDQPPQFVHV